MNSRSLIATGLVCAAAQALSVTLAKAGPLDPPAGPIAPTHKTLTEVEPRIAVSADNTPGDADSVFKISQSGSYYLLGDVVGERLKHGIEITAPNVTLDLNGFTLQGVVGSFSGVVVNAPTQSVRIFNGAARDWGLDGLTLSNADRAEVRNVTAAGNGLAGIRVGDGAVVENCLAKDNAAEGLVAGSGSTITRCTASFNSGDGFAAGQHCVLTGCTAFGNLSNGFNVSDYASIERCAANSNTDLGVLTGVGSTVLGSTASANGAGGVKTGDSSTVKDNSA